MTDYQRAFITPDVLFYNDHFVDVAVVPERDNNELMISIYPITPPVALAGLEIMIAQSDLTEVQRLLGEERPVVQPLAVEQGITLRWLNKALKTLRLIADLDEEKQEPDDSWREVLFRCIEYAQHTVDHIEIDAAQEGIDLEADDANG